MRSMIRIGLLLLLTFGGGCSREQGMEGAGSAVTSVPAISGPNAQALLALQDPQAAFAVRADVRASYRVGEELRFEVLSAESGELHVVQVDQSDVISVLLPNVAIASNRIEAGKSFVFPPRDSGVHMLAEGPAGASLLAFFVTREGQSLAAIVPGLVEKSSPTRGLSLQEGPATPTPAPQSVPVSTNWSFALYTIRLEDAGQ